MRRSAVWVVAGFAAVGACLDFASLSDGAGALGDGGADGDGAGADAAQPRDGGGDGGATTDATTFDVVVTPTTFAIVLTPPHVTLDPGESTKVTVTVVRGSAFADSVDITVQGLGADLTTNPPTVTVPSGTNDGSFTVVAAAGAKVPADLALDVLALSKRDSSITAVAKLGVRVGSFFAAATSSTTLTLPTWATELDVKVWGAGGGAGGMITLSSGTAWGGAGGGGGYTSARVKVDAMQPLAVTVATGGASGQDHLGAPIAPMGGGGGGYSAVKQGVTTLLLAGGGGGGGGATGVNNSGQCQAEFAVYLDGLGGGGAAGEAPQSALLNRSATTSAGGSADVDAGASPGTTLQGGEGANPTVAAGSPGGGRGGFADDGCFGLGGGGGGGGGGAFGGGSGVGRQGIYGSHLGGGGGGSGTVIAGATGIVQSAAKGPAPPAATDPDYLAPAGVGGARGTASAPAGAGAPGRVVVRFAKP